MRLRGLLNEGRGDGGKSTAVGDKEPGTTKKDRDRDHTREDFKVVACEFYSPLPQVFQRSFFLNIVCSGRDARRATLFERYGLLLPIDVVRDVDRGQHQQARAT
ncbi:unnamed protein product [Gadus morhua 'NCC']